MPESAWRVDRKQKPQTLTGRPILPLRFSLDQLQHRKSSLSARRVPDPHSGVDTILEQGGGTLARNGAVETVSGATAMDACTGEEKPVHRVYSQNSCQDVQKEFKYPIHPGRVRELQKLCDGSAGVRGTHP